MARRIYTEQMARFLAMSANRGVSYPDFVAQWHALGWDHVPPLSTYQNNATYLQLGMRVEEIVAMRPSFSRVVAYLREQGRAR